MKKKDTYTHYAIILTIPRDVLNKPQKGSTTESNLIDITRDLRTQLNWMSESEEESLFQDKSPLYKVTITKI